MEAAAGPALREEESSNHLCVWCASTWCVIAAIGKVTGPGMQSV